MSSTSPTTRESCHGWLVSLVFWICLFSASALYATVVLSPKLLTYLALDRDFRENQWRLVALDKQITHLEKVIEAQTHDPAFVREQARSAFDVAGPAEQRIPVESHLRLNIEGAAPSATESATPRTLPWYAPLLSAVARSHGLDNVLLGVSAALVLYAFTFLHDGRPSLRGQRPAPV